MKSLRNIVYSSHSVFWHFSSFRYMLKVFLGIKQ